MSSGEIILIVIGLAILVLLVLVLTRKSEDPAAAALQKELAELRAGHAQESRENREEMGRNIQGVNAAIHSQISEMGLGQLKQLGDLGRSNEEALERLRKTVDEKLLAIQKDNEKKLEDMRRTVDEKLSDTLNKRLGESFQVVSERLDQVHKGLGEMQNLSTNLVDIKKIFANVKSRGIWGEVQLAQILEEILTPDQYAADVATGAKAGDKVEFALILPGRDPEQTGVYLPIDAKFPLEDYQRLLEAQEAGDAPAAAEARKKLERMLKDSAKQIAEKYIEPPKTLEYAIMFLPTEGLYSEALRLPGFMETAQSFHVLVAGPTNLAALLNSIRLGFRTLAIEAKSGEIRNLLATVKAEVERFGLLVAKAQKSLSAAGNHLEQAAKRSDKIGRQLQNIEIEQIEQIEQTEKLDAPGGEEGLPLALEYDLEEPDNRDKE